jgi:hypothetical protein
MGLSGDDIKQLITILRTVRDLVTEQADIRATYGYNSNSPLGDKARAKHELLEKRIALEFATFDFIVADLVES